MFEFGVARKYLVPRVRQLSRSIISLISLFVIATVVWLSIVFFSAQEGIERSWTEKLVALTAPLRLTPTPDYYNSYYYQIDSYASSSHYASKTLREKLHASSVDPYDPESDPGLPPGMLPKSELDIVKETVQTINSLPNVTSNIFETAACTIKVHLVRDAIEQVLESRAYLMSYNPKNARLKVESLKKLPDNGVVLPKGFKEAGVQIGDEGYIGYQGFGTTGTHEMRFSVSVAGFYDPGIIPVGGKVILASTALVEQVLAATFSEDRALPTGLMVDFGDIKSAKAIKNALVQKLQAKNLAKYWNVQTYDEFEFTKDIFQQMKSDKNLFSLISVIITIVACSNIISMLIILVHDKRKEVAILRALGATKTSIGAIFGLCGFLLGAVGAIVGALLSILTLHNLQAILAFLGKLQGFEVLSSTYYANTLPSEVSLSALGFVLIVAALGAMLAGIIPAIQASRINTSEALRNE